MLNQSIYCPRTAGRPLALFGIIAALALPMAGSAEVLVEDTWSAGVRNVQQLPQRSAWYYTSATRLVAAPGSMTATVDSSRLAITYFTNAGPRQLGDGETLKVTVEFTPQGVNTASASRGMRIGLFNYGATPRLFEDGFSSSDNGAAGVTGYLLNMNFSATVNVANPMELRRREGDQAGFTANGNLMGSVPGSGLYGAAFATGGPAQGGPAFVSGTRYRLEYSVARDGATARVTARFSDGGGWSAEVAGDSAVNPVFDFDAFAMRMDGPANTAATVVFHSFKVEVTGQDPGEDPVDPQAMAAFRGRSVDRGDGWFENSMLGYFNSPSADEPFLYFQGKASWMYLAGTVGGQYYLYDLAGGTWWATRFEWDRLIWSYAHGTWFYFDGVELVALVYSAGKDTWPDAVATAPGLVMLYDTGEGTWWAGRKEWDGFYWGYANPGWFYLSNGVMVPAGEEPPVSGLTGYAAVAGMGLATTTGGKGGPVVHVDSIAQLKAEAAGSAPKIIVVTGSFEGADSISVGSNKTILGAHPGAYLRGIGFEISNQSNVIIRNFRISHVLADVANDGDCIRVVNGSHHVWIDHCELFNDNPREQTNKDLYDGLTDITNGSDFVTISWSHYHDHHKFVLIGSTDTASTYNDDQHLRVTMHHNLLENPYRKDSRIGTRIPSLRFGKAHCFNNVYRNLGEGIRARHPSAMILVEENVFDYLGYCWFSEDGGSFTIGYNLMINEANKDPRVVPLCDPPFAPPYDYSAFIDPAAEVEAIVVAGAGVGRIDPMEGLP